MRSKYMMWPCILGLAMAMAMVATTGAPRVSLASLVMLMACPAMMFVMMRSMGQHASAPTERGDATEKDDVGRDGADRS